MKNNLGDIKSQSNFCSELMLRLNHDIQSSGEGTTYSGMMKDYTRKQEDIRRIRRELMDLQKMLYPYEVRT